MAIYDAFISYSHAKDKPIAKELQAVMQTLGKPWYRLRALQVFRDDTSLSATPELWPSIVRSLDRSRYLVLLASPESAASSWVAKEVEWWLANKSPETLLLGLTDGKLNWNVATQDFLWGPAAPPLPSCLKGRFPARAEMDRSATLPNFGQTSLPARPRLCDVGGELCCDRSRRAAAGSAF